MSMLEPIGKGNKYIKVTTTNLQKTMKFYLDLGFETILRTFNKKANEQVAYLQFKDIVIKTNENLNANGKLVAIDYISINSSDIEKTFKNCKNRGYDLIDDEIQYLSFGESRVRFFIVKGPSEERIEFYQKL